MQIAFVVWPHTTNKIFIWGTDHGSMTWLNVSLMFHFIGVAILLLGQYLFVYFAIDFFYTCFRKYETDLEDKEIGIKLEFSNEKEYTMLMNELDED